VSALILDEADRRGQEASESGSPDREADSYTIAFSRYSVSVL
jgi:hypothetical protein